MAKLFYLILFGLALVSCFEDEQAGDNKNESSTLNSTSTKKIEPLVKENKDFINSHNVEEKLLEYGEKNPENIVILHTQYGAMKFKLYDNTPMHRANFIMLNKLQFYDSTIFYRVMKGFMIQGGSPMEEDELGRSSDRKTWSIGNYRIPAEFVKNNIHKRGVIAMANDSDLYLADGKKPVYTSDPFQFYIVHQRRGAKHLDNRFTVFGEMISGFDVLDKIANDPVEEEQNHYPINPINMWCEVK